MDNHHFSWDRYPETGQFPSQRVSVNSESTKSRELTFITINHPYWHIFGGNSVSRKWGSPSSDPVNQSWKFQWGSYIYSKWNHPNLRNWDRNPSTRLAADSGVSAAADPMGFSHGFPNHHGENDAKPKTIGVLGPFSKLDDFGQCFCDDGS